MQRTVLNLVTLGLLLLVLADRVADAVARLSPKDEPVQGASDTRSATADVEAGNGDIARRETPHRIGAGGRARLARLAAREQLSREAETTYLDSLILSTDSVVRRWPDRLGSPIRIHIVEGGAPGYLPKMAGYVLEAFNRWESTGIGIRFQRVADSTGADIMVRWIDHFDFDRAGQTDLTWDQTGRVRRAAISLALRSHTHVPLPEPALRSVAVHEVGHALGLPHSADSNDVMFPATRTGMLSLRDRRTVAVLYRLAPGPVGEELDAPAPGRRRSR